MCVLLFFFIFLFFSVCHVCVVSGAWTQGPAFVSALGRNLIGVLFSIPSELLWALFSAAFFFVLLLFGLGTLFWGRGHYGLTASTYLRRCAHTYRTLIERGFTKKARKSDMYWQEGSVMCWEVDLDSTRLRWIIMLDVFLDYRDCSILKACDCHRRGA